MSQVLVNLLGNAVKFTAHGSIELRGRVVRQEVGCWMLRIEVQDTGPGVAPDRQVALFNAFEQADSSTTRLHGGTGLGLALVRHLVGMMGGEVGLHSTPGLGSCFWFSCWLDAAAADDVEPLRRVAQPLLWSPPKPAAALRSPVPPSPAAAAEGPLIESSLARLRRLHAGQRLLLAEDNPVNQTVGRALLEHAQLQVVVVENGVDAGKLALTSPFDLLLVDLQMPLQGGLSAAREIRARLPDAPPILAMTANAFVDDVRACLAAGMNGHVSKPVDPQRLYATLLQWLPLPAAEPGSTVLGRLARLVGLDFEVALEQCAGQGGALLVATLRLFSDRYRGGAEELRAAQAAAAPEAWWQASHSLRGACAAVGLAGLAQRLLAVEDALRGESPGSKDLAVQTLAIDRELIALIEGIDACLRV